MPEKILRTKWGKGRPVDKLHQERAALVKPHTCEAGDSGYCVHCGAVMSEDEYPARIELGAGFLRVGYLDKGKVEELALSSSRFGPRLKLKFPREFDINRAPTYRMVLELVKDDPTLASLKEPRLTAAQEQWLRRVCESSVLFVVAQEAFSSALIRLHELGLVRRAGYTVYRTRTGEDYLKHLDARRAQKKAKKDGLR